MNPYTQNPEPEEQTAPPVEEQKAPERTPVEQADALAEAAQGTAAQTWWHLVGKAAAEAPSFEAALLTAQRTYPRAHRAMIRESNPDNKKVQK